VAADVTPTPTAFLLFDHLPQDMSCAGLMLLCEKYAPVVFSKIVRDRGYRSLGFGYVQMESAAGAELVLRSLHHSTLQGQILTVEFVQKLPTGYGPAAR
jgi:RNA recognition motif. (a.k.a. RRM, RBD, or RNP domain)